MGLRLVPLSPTLITQSQLPHSFYNQYLMLIGSKEVLYREVGLQGLCLRGNATPYPCKFTCF